MLFLNRLNPIPSCTRSSTQQTPLKQPLKSLKKQTFQLPQKIFNQSNRQKNFQTRSRKVQLADIFQRFLCLPPVSKLLSLP